MASVTSFINRRLKLKVNSEKSAVARPADRKFLGFSFTRGQEPRRRIAPKALERFKRRIRELTRRTRGVSVERIVADVATYLRGWHGYFRFCETRSVLRDLDSWVRRRLRAVSIRGMASPGVPMGSQSTPDSLDSPARSGPGVSSPRRERMVRGEHRGNLRFSPRRPVQESVSSRGLQVTTASADSSPSASARSRIAPGSRSA